MKNNKLRVEDLFYLTDNTNRQNPVTLSRVKEDIRKRGILEPHIYVASDGEIISGNHRVQIARELGLEYTSQLKIHNLGDISQYEKFRLAEMYNTRGEAFEPLRAITFFRMYKYRFIERKGVGNLIEEKIKGTELSKLVLNKFIVNEICEEFIYSAAAIRHYLTVGYALIGKYVWLLNKLEKVIKKYKDVRGVKMLSNLHIFYIVTIGKNTKTNVKVLDDDIAIKIAKVLVDWLISEYIKSIKKTIQEDDRKVPNWKGVDKLQAKIRSVALIVFKQELEDITDVPWPSIWYPNKRLESIRHVVEDHIQLGSYSTKLLSLTRESKISTFNTSIAFNVIRLLSRDYNIKELTQKFKKLKIVDPCCGMGIRVVTGLMMDHNAFGYDISINTISKIKEKYEDYAKSFKVHNSVKGIPHKDNFADLVFTSPPYWNLEKYKESDGRLWDKSYLKFAEGQLSSYNKYNDFIEDYAKLIKECVRVSKKYIVFVVSNFRVNKKYYDFCRDTQNLFAQYDVELFDKIILGHDIGAPTGGTKSIINNHTRSAHEEMFIYKKV